jgi:TolB-like protein/DNA-binding winged helix-turn-helix (wHTH) protein/Flp pilus assembly protein TadD
MHQILSTDILLCWGFRLDRLGLSRLDPGGIASPVALGTRALDLAWLLADRHGELISKDEIMETVWPGRVVEENNLTVQISTLRRVFDQARAEGSCIQTVVGHGYRFVAPVTRVAAEALSTPGAAPSSGNGIGELIVAGDEQAHRPAGRETLPRTPAATTRTGPPLWVGLIAASIVALGLIVLAVREGHGHRAWREQAQSAPRLSIVVLPFTNFGDDGQQYFADGITDGMTSDLSRLPDMLVISRNTAFTYRKKSVDTKAIGRELNVRYVLEGSVQRSGNRVRVNAQLIDAAADTHLWAERFDGDASDLFALQNEIITRIAVELKIELAGAEVARPAEHPDSLDYILRALALVTPLSREKLTEMVSLLEHALALDPGSVEAQSFLANVLAGRVLANMTDSAATDLERANGLIERALAAAPLSVAAHNAKAQLLRAQRRFAEAIPEYEIVLSLDRNWVYAYFGLGQCKMLTGSIDETIPLIERAIRLSPRDSQLGVWYQTIGLVHLLQSRTDEAIVWFEKASNAMPAHPIFHEDLAAAYGIKGETERAAAELDEARRLSADDRDSSIARLSAVHHQYHDLDPKIRTFFETIYFAGLRKAGMPEQ